MENKRFFGCMVLMVFILTITGCGNNDTWSGIISLDQINGTWQGSYNQSWTKKEAWEAEGQTWTPEMEATYGDMRETFNGDITYSVNSSTKTSGQMMKSTYTLSGGTIDSYWPSFSAVNTDREGVTVDDLNHSITFTTTDTYSVGIGDFNDLQINRNGTKIKIPASDRQPEITLIRQN